MIVSPLRLLPVRGSNSAHLSPRLRPPRSSATHTYTHTTLILIPARTEDSVLLPISTLCLPRAHTRSVPALSTTLQPSHRFSHPPFHEVIVSLLKCLCSKLLNVTWTGVRGFVASDPCFQPVGKYIPNTTKSVLVSYEKVKKTKLLLKSHSYPLWFKVFFRLSMQRDFVCLRICWFPLP